MITLFNSTNYSYSGLADTRNFTSLSSGKTKPVLVAAISLNINSSGSLSVQKVSYDGIAMSQFGGNEDCLLWVLSNQNSGSHNLVIDYEGTFTSAVTVTVYEFDNVSSTIAVEQSGFSLDWSYYARPYSLTTTLGISSYPAMMVDCIGFPQYNGTANQGAGQTAIGNSSYKYVDATPASMNWSGQIGTVPPGSVFQSVIALAENKSIVVSETNTMTDTLLEVNGATSSETDTITSTDTAVVVANPGYFKDSPLCSSYISNYKWLTQTLLDAQQKPNVIPYIQCKIIDDTITPNSFIGSVSQTNGSSVTAPDGTILIAGKDGNGNLSFWKIADASVSSSFNAVSFIIDSSGNYRSDLNCAISVSDWINGTYSIDIYYFLVSGGNTVVVHKQSFDGGNTFSSISTNSIGISNTALSSIAAGKPILDINNNLTHIFFYTKEVSSRGVVAYQYSSNGTSFGPDTIWSKKRIDTLDWNINSIDSYYLNEQYYVVFSAYHNYQETTNGNYSIYLTSISDPTSSVNSDIWKTPINILTSLSSSQNNQNTFTVPKANIYNGKVYLVFNSIEVTSIQSSSSIPSSSNPVTTTTSYFLLESSDGENFTYPNTIGQPNGNILNDTLSYNFVNQGSFFYTIGNGQVMQYIQNDVVADVSDYVISYAVNETTNSASTISVVIGNQNNQWYSNSPSNSSLISSYDKSHANFSFPDFPVWATPFQATETIPITSSSFYLQSTGSVSGYGYSYLYTAVPSIFDGVLVPGTLLATSDSFDLSALSVNPIVCNFNFSGLNQYKMSSGQNYCVVVDLSGYTPVPTPTLIDSLQKVYNDRDSFSHSSFGSGMPAATMVQNSMTAGYEIAQIFHTPGLNSDSYFLTYINAYLYSNTTGSRTGNLTAAIYLTKSDGLGGKIPDTSGAPIATSTPIAASTMTSVYPAPMTQFNFSSGVLEGDFEYCIILENDANDYGFGWIGQYPPYQNTTTHPSAYYNTGTSAWIASPTFSYFFLINANLSPYPIAYLDNVGEGIYPASFETGGTWVSATPAHTGYATTWYLIYGISGSYLLPGYLAIDKNHKICISNGYYNSLGVPETVPRNVFYIDDLTQSVSSTTNVLALSGRDIMKQPLTLVSRFADTFEGSSYNSDVFDGTTVSNWSQVSGGWIQNNNQYQTINSTTGYYPGYDAGKDYIITYSIAPKYCESYFFAVTSTLPDQSSYPNSKYFYTFFQDSNNWVRFRVSRVDAGPAQYVVFYEIMVEGVVVYQLSQGFEVTTTSTVEWYVVIRKFNYTQFAFDIYADSGNSSSQYSFTPAFSWDPAIAGTTDISSYLEAGTLTNGTVGFGSNGSGPGEFSNFKFIQQKHSYNTKELVTTLLSKSFVSQSVFEEVFDENMYTPSNWTGTNFNLNHRILSLTENNLVYQNQIQVANNEIEFEAKFIPDSNSESYFFDTIFRLSNIITNTQYDGYCFRNGNQIDSSSAPIAYSSFFIGAHNSSLNRLCSTSQVIVDNTQSENNINIDWTKWHTYKLVFTDSYFLGFIDGELVVSWNDNNTTNTWTSGSFGFNCSGGTVQIKNITSSYFWKQTDSVALNSGDDFSTSINTQTDIIKAWNYSDTMGRFISKLLFSTDESEYTYEDVIATQDTDNSDIEYVNKVTVTGLNVVATATDNASITQTGKTREVVIEDYKILTYEDALNRANLELQSYNIFKNQSTVSTTYNVGSELLDVITIKNTGDNSSNTDQILRIYSEQITEDVKTSKISLDAGNQ